MRLLKALGNPSVSMNPARLPFPLNVYGLTLALEYGAMEHLHFGVFPNGDSKTLGYPNGQSMAQDSLRALLPPAPASVLEYGFGTANLARLLAAGGYEITAITPIYEEFNAACATTADGVEYLHLELGDFHAENSFDVLLLQQSSQYLDPLLLLAKANAVLREGGRLLIAEEFLLDDSERSPQARPLLANFLRLAQRCGFSAERQREMGRQVATGLELFAGLIRKHVAVLSAQLELSRDDLIRLEQQLMLMASRYQSAQLGYTLLDLRRGPLALEQAVFGSIDAMHYDEVKPLFESSFETDFDPMVWEWKYGAGRGRAVIARQNGELVAHYGGAPRDIVYFGEACKAIQICDVMVMPEHRGFVSRDTLFFKTAATFLEQQVGNSAEHLLGFGFPNMRVLRVARRLGLYDVTDEFIELQYTTQAVDEDSTFDIVAFDLLAPEAPAVVDSLWLEMLAGLQHHIVGKRDWTYWHYRYCQHPNWARGLYECLALREKHNGQLKAVVLLKHQQNGRLLMDIVGDVTQFTVYLEALRTTLAQRELTLCCRTTRAQAATFALPNAHWQELEIEIPCNIWTRGPSPEHLSGAWWLTAGDMDFL